MYVSFSQVSIYIYKSNSRSFSLNKKSFYICANDKLIRFISQMTAVHKRLWLLVAEKTGSNLEARMVYDELLKQLNMSKEIELLKITETEKGLEVRISEKAYGNYALIGLIEQIKFNLLNTEDTGEVDTLTKDQKYDA